MSQQNIQTFEQIPVQHFVQVNPQPANSHLIRANLLNEVEVLRSELETLQKENQVLKKENQILKE
ncbi:7662_t:CDS:1, partial [Scutellospora calospora]